MNTFCKVLALKEFLSARYSETLSLLSHAKTKDNKNASIEKEKPNCYKNVCKHRQLQKGKYASTQNP